MKYIFTTTKNGTKSRITYYSLHFGILQEFALVNLLLDGVDGRKIIGHAILLPRPRIPRGVRYREAKLFLAVHFRKALHQQIDEGSLCLMWLVL